MGSKKLLHEQQMVAEAAAAGFCRPPREKRSEYYGRSSQNKRQGFRGLDYKKFMDEQQALEQAEAVGFCIPRALSKLSSSTQWDLRSGTLTVNSRSSRRTTSKNIWRGSGDAPTTEFSNATSRMSTDSRSRSNGDEEDDEEESTERNLSDESLLPHELYKPENSVFEPRRPQMNVIARCPSHDTCHTDILTRCTDKEPRVADKGPLVVDKEPLVVDKEPSFPDMPHEKIRDDGMPMTKVAALALIYGLILFIIAEIIFQKYGRGCQTPKRAKHSLLRMLIDDIIYFTVRHFAGPNYLPEE